VKYLLEQIVGRNEVTFEEFYRRRWQRGEETVHAYLLVLKNWAAQLGLPPGLVKTQFLSGMPAEVGKDLLIYDDEGISCERLASIVEKIIKRDSYVMAVQDTAARSATSSSQDRTEAPPMSEKPFYQGLQRAVEFLTEEVAALRTSNSSLAGATYARSNGNVPRGPCTKCGRRGHWAKDCRGGTCHSCGQTGHWSKTCPKNSTGPVFRPAEF